MTAPVRPNLDAMVIDAAGKRAPASFAKAADPAIDCFYVYPTTSTDATMFSDLSPDAQEMRAVHGQAARLGAKCRLFVPIYHQFTMAALRYSMVASAAPTASDLDVGVPYRDVLAAWTYYLKHDNRGRGVVLIGHSQGAMLLKQLIAEQIDDKPAQKLLVAAYLAGNAELTEASFRTIKACHMQAETGCLVAWSSYLEGDTSKRVFGSSASGAHALCTNPAAPAGGRGALQAYLPKPSFAPASDPPMIELVGLRLSGECVADAAGSVLRVRVEPGPFAELLRGLLARSASSGWGLHPLDISLVQGNMIDMIGAQTITWGKR